MDIVHAESIVKAWCYVNKLTKSQWVITDRDHNEISTQILVPSVQAFKELEIALLRVCARPMLTPPGWSNIKLNLVVVEDK